MNIDHVRLSTDEQGQGLVCLDLCSEIITKGVWWTYIVPSHLVDLYCRRGYPLCWYPTDTMIHSLREATRSMLSRYDSHGLYRSFKARLEDYTTVFAFRACNLMIHVDDNACTNRESPTFTHPPSPDAAQLVKRRRPWRARSGVVSLLI